MSAACAVIVGSAFDSTKPNGIELSEVEFVTPFGPATLHRVGSSPAYLLFRHGSPHRLLPNQINYRANAWALREAGVRSLLVTSSVGVMQPSFPLFVPLPVADLVMPDNRLPDGTACTMFTGTQGRSWLAPGHLVLNGGLFSSALSGRLNELADAAEVELGPPAIFTYVQGPRTKTAAENRELRDAGAQVNSMTFAPEVILANELEISVAGVVVGHKYSVAGKDNPDEAGIEESLVRSRTAMENLIVSFLRDCPVVPYENHVFRFGGGE